MPKINIVSINVAFAILYGIAFLIDQKTGSAILKNIIGTIYLLFVIPFTVLQTINIRDRSKIETYFLMLVFFFSVYVPLYYFLNRYLAFAISIQNIVIVNTCIFIASLITISIRRLPIRNYSIPSIRFAKIKQEAFVIGALLAYAGLHTLNYHFYGFIPEWDSYGDLIRINQGLETGFIQQNYRGFFATSAQIVSVFSGINPYSVFSVIFIALQSTLILSIRVILGRYAIQAKSLEVLAYIAALSIPVINMEIDMVRPQNVFIILFPIFLIFASRFLAEKHIPSAIAAVIITTAGINYHEFFIFPFFISLGWIGFVIMRKTYQTQNKKDKTIFALILALCFLLIVILSKEIPFISGTIAIAEKIATQILDISSWRPWFLGRYASDGEALQMGWPGFGGALKYYAYYLSPFLAAILGTLVFLAIKSASFRRDPLIQISIPFLIVFLLFSEIFPRLNYLYLPERFWLLTDIVLVLTAVPILRSLTRNKQGILFVVLLFVFCAIGLGGSIYVTKNKSSLTSPREYSAALWIRTNTPDTSVFISQSANGPMIKFFAERTMIPIEPEYFLSEKIIEQSPENEIKKLQDSLDKEYKKVSRLTEKFTSNEISFFDFSDSIQERKIAIKKKNEVIKQWTNAINQPKYIVYSYDKFDTIYNEREWWRRANFYGADIEKFNRTYPLVYHDSGVYIWKVR